MHDEFEVLYKAIAHSDHGIWLQYTVFKMYSQGLCIEKMKGDLPRRAVCVHKECIETGAAS